MTAAIIAVMAACEQKPETTEPTAPNPVEVLKNEAAPTPTAPLGAGDVVYDFSALAHNGERFRLSDYLAKPVVIYFCPQDQAEPCRQLAESIRDQWLLLNPSLSMVFAVSPEDTVVHRDFASEHELPHLLVADASLRVHQVMGIRPGTIVSYLVGTERNVLHVFQPPSAEHGKELRAMLQRLKLLAPLPPK